MCRFFSHSSHHILLAFLGLKKNFCPVSEYLSYFDIVVISTYRHCNVRVGLGKKPLFFIVFLWINFSSSLLLLLLDSTVPPARANMRAGGLWAAQI